jgi:hypothetical protein
LSLETRPAEKFFKRARPRESRKSFVGVCAEAIPTQNRIIASSSDLMMFLPLGRVKGINLYEHGITHACCSSNKPVNKVL